VGFHILIPENGFRDDAPFERAVFASEATFDVRAWLDGDPARVPDESWRKADALFMAARMLIRAPTIAKLDRCKVVVRYGAGYDNCDGEALGKAGIALFNVPDYHRGEIADHAIAMLLALRRGLLTHFDRLREDTVKGWIPIGGGALVRRIEGSSIGVIGIGAIGKQAARRAHAFGMNVLFYDPYVRASDPGVAGYRKVEQLDDLLAQCDALTFHCPLTSETHGMVDAARIARVKPGAVLVNTARGPVVDPDAVYHALKSGTLGGAALDVLPTEPLANDHPLGVAYREQPDWARGRLLITPHAAFYSPESVRDMRTLVAQRALDYMRNGATSTCVNLDALDRKLAAARIGSAKQ
jgi:phosphoglycerate dehydrogenase-like enzyme